MAKRLLRTGMSVLMAAALVACGGGGGGGSGGGAPPDPQGGFSGTATRVGVPGSVDFDLLVLDDGTYYGFVGSDVPGAPDVEITAMLQGQGTVTGNVFTATNGREFQFGAFDTLAGPDMPFYTARVDHAVSASISAIGAADSSFGRLTYSAAFQPAYNTPVPLADVAGNYIGSTRRLAGDQAIAATITAGGALTAVSGVCSITGSLVQRPGGRRVFDLVVNYTAPTCALTGFSFTGVAFNSSPTNLILAGVLPDRSDALFAVLVKLP